MTPERWQQIDQLFHSALEHEFGERAAFLAQACNGDESVRQEVESLIGSHEQSESFFEATASDIAAELLAGRETRLRPGQAVGHYQIVSLLGEGGMGEVYLARDVRLGRQVALKRLPAQFTLDADWVRRFEQEGRAVSALNHPNIVTIHEIGSASSLHFITTEFIDGETLRQQLGRERLKLDEVLEISTQVASALAAAHAARIVHRDIKPENIMIRPDGYVKVLDFGLAKLVEQKNKSFPGLEESTAEETQTARNVILGTVNYMSPEQAKGERVDERSDIFSLGTVIHEMIAGKTPFAGDSMSETFANLINADPQPLSRSGLKVPDKLQRIVSKTLRKNKNERYQTIEALLADLKDLKEHATFYQDLERSDSADDNATGVLQATKSDADKQTAETKDSVSQRITPHKLLAAFALAALLIGGVGLGYYFLYARKTAPGADGRKSIAVLPLKPINMANRDQIYEMGIAESLILRLSSMKGLRVRPLSATRKYADIWQDPIAAGKEEKVDYVLASNYQLAGGKLRITAQLFNVASGEIEETYKSEKDTNNAFAVEDAIAREVGNILLARFKSTSHTTAKRGTSNEEAYRLYLQGMYLANNRNPEDAQRAVEALEQAVRLDPSYALAWAGLAYAHRPVGHGGNTHEAYLKSIEAINKALALDKNLACAYSTLCENKMYYEYDFEGAEGACQRAIEQNPDSSQAHDIYARFLISRGRHDEAISEIKTAIDLEPTSRYSQRNLGLALFYARRYQEAVTQLRRVVAMDKNFDTAYFWLSTALALQGNESEAFEWFMKLQSLRKVDGETVQAYKTAFQRSGWQGVLRVRVKNLEKGGEGYIDGAAYHANLGNKDKAFEYLEKSYQERRLWTAYFQVDPRLDALRDDPRFDGLVRRIESR